MNFLLFLLAIALITSLAPIGIIYNLIRNLFELNIRYRKYAILIDIMGNVFMGTLFNDILIKKNGHLFGSYKETISAVLGYNKQLNTLTKLGRLLADFLNYLSPYHVENAIGSNIKYEESKKEKLKKVFILTTISCVIVYLLVLLVNIL